MLSDVLLEIKIYLTETSQIKNNYSSECPLYVLFQCTPFLSYRPFQLASSCCLKVLGFRSNWKKEFLRLLQTYRAVSYFKRFNFAFNDSENPDNFKPDVFSSAVS